LRDRTWIDLDKLRYTRVKVRDTFNRELKKALLDIYFKQTSRYADEL